MGFKERLDEAVSPEQKAQAYRIIADEPIGVAIGFKPEGVVADEMELLADDGGNNVFIIQVPGKADRLIISADSLIPNLAIYLDTVDASEADVLSAYGLNKPIYPEPDQMIFRNEEEFEEWKEEGL